jgi:hypothetical protein
VAVSAPRNFERIALTSVSHHLDQDLKLYTCLSETCAEPPQLFIRFQEWSQHMDEHHSTNWIEEVHKPLGWCCDVEHNDLYFEDEDEYDRHVQETHPEYVAEKAELKEWGELQRERPPYTCPICNCVPEELAVIFPWLREGKLTNPTIMETGAATRAQAEREKAARDRLLLHIGTHLKQLGLVSVAYFRDDADGNSMESKRGSILVDKDGKVFLVETPQDYLDPQFEDYMVPTEPKLVDEGVDWSEVKNLNVENESAGSDHDPILQRFRSHQLFSRGLRLLRVNVDSSFSLTSFAANNIPSYAILSHMWEGDDQEVTFRDLIDAVGSTKTGYRKIRFCGEQAQRDGLQYFWVDSCCIDKSSSAELTEAINSMFLWYRNAAKCYVYLSDVSTPAFTTKKKLNTWSWDSDFRKSKWFTRGWTVQELLAPGSVEFFSQEGKRLGDKGSLKQQIHEITRIADSALQGAPLRQFSVDERLSWIERRQTKREEDKAYSLLGIFEVHMPVIYGEGEENAFRRLKTSIYIQQIRLTDPRDDKKRVEETKGGLLEESYHWIFKNSDFQQWRNDQQIRLLWISGDPGKGKTMLLCGIINELKKTTAKTDLLSYFFCQAADSRMNNATAVLRGLVYLLVDQQPSLISHIRKKYDQAGKILFEDANAWVALSEIFTNILQDPSLNTTYLIIDALDECVVDLPKLLDFIVQQSNASSPVKWIVSSRNWPSIEDRLERAGQNVGLCLELNSDSVSTAVGIFIQRKTLQLAQLKKYDEKTRVAVQQYLVSNANDTFLWVALVCQNLVTISRRKTLARLNAFPPGLDSLYQRMIEQIYNTEEADLCKQILASIVIVYRPITLKELTSVVEMLEDMSDDLHSLREIIGLCGSFLTIREGIIYFVHQSAKDFLLSNVFDGIFPSGIGEAHYVIFSRSLQVMSKTLRRDIYHLHALGYPIEQVKTPDPDPLATSRYSCIHWVDHLCDWNLSSGTDSRVDLQDGGAVNNFIREKYLYWLEAVSLCRNMSDGVISLAKLEALIQVILKLLILYIYKASADTK